MRQPKKSAQPAAPDARSRAAALRARATGSSADPILALIEEGHAMLGAFRVASRLPDTLAPLGQPTFPAEDLSEAEQAQANRLGAALLDHFRDRLLPAKPITAAGGIALARYVTDYCHLTGYQFEALADDAYDYDGATALKVLAAIAAAPLA